MRMGYHRAVGAIRWTWMVWNSVVEGTYLAKVRPWSLPWALRAACVGRMAQVVVWTLHLDPAWEAVGAGQCEQTPKVRDQNS
mmetsp:Transcript_9984/g.27959  ORF Transcript_9984/g.27959 Transcript_9984/m.27959 type:complete len:82 (+) Transcript_9984:629-874(+)